MDESERGRRRIDRILAPGFLEDLEARTAGDVRLMRDDCRQEEGRLSYARRLLQARMDIVAAEAARRESGESEAGLLDSLPSILAGQRNDRREPPSGARSVAFYSPQEDDGRRVDDGVLDDPILAKLADLDAEALHDLQERLKEEERETSRVRGLVQQRLDELQAELVRRYRDGEAAVDEVVVGRSTPRSPDRPGAS